MKVVRLLLVLCVVAPTCGCTMFDRALHELKPHRLWRFNRHDAPGRADSAFFSVRDGDEFDSAGLEPGLPQSHSELKQREEGQ